MYLNSVIDNQIKTFLDKQFTVDSGTTSDKQKTLHYSLPHVRYFAHLAKKKLRHICECFVKTLILKLHFHHQHLVVASVVRAPYLNLFSPMSLSVYLCRMLLVIVEHLEKDKKSHIYSHLQENPQCQEKVNLDCFEIIDSAFSYFRLQLKEAMHINWKNPELNKQVKQVGITISI